MTCQVRDCSREAVIDKRGTDAVGVPFHIRLCGFCYLRCFAMVMREPAAAREIRHFNRHQPEAIRDAIEVVAAIGDPKRAR